MDNCHLGKTASTIREFSKRSGLCVANLYEEIRQGRLKARKFGRRTLILEEDGRAFLAALPLLQLPPREVRQRRS